jgi:hypothetical protein
LVFLPSPPFGGFDDVSSSPSSVDNIGFMLKRVLRHKTAIDVFIFGWEIEVLSKGGEDG